MIKLLLVDDEQIIREGIAAILPLDCFGIELTAVCANAFDALDSMADNMPDILVADIRMPKMDGLALIERAMTLNPLLQCLILSGYDEFAYAQRAIKLGVKEYLLKPCSKQKLSDAIGRMCKEIDKQHKQAQMQLDDRHERIVDLASRLATLAPDQYTGVINPEQIRKAAWENGDERLLREAYTYLITHSEAEAERGYEIIRQTYENEGNLFEEIAKGLTAVLHPLGQYRPFVQKMCSYIQAHYGDEKLSLQYLADQVVHMRADYIGREFYRDTGMKLSAYLLRIRMERAKAMLAVSSEEQHVYEVAERVGLGHNPQYFSQLFRKYTGYTPKEYGKNVSPNSEP